MRKPEQRDTKYLSKSQLAHGTVKVNPDSLSPKPVFSTNFSVPSPQLYVSFMYNMIGKKSVFLKNIFRIFPIQIGSIKWLVENKLSYKGNSAPQMILALEEGPVAMFILQDLHLPSSASWTRSPHLIPKNQSKG